MYSPAIAVSIIVCIFLVVVVAHHYYEPVVKKKQQELYEQEKLKGFEWATNCLYLGASIGRIYDRINGDHNFSLGFHEGARNAIYTWEAEKRKPYIVGSGLHLQTEIKQRFVEM